MTRARYALPIAVAAWAAIATTVFAVAGAHPPVVDEWGKVTAGYRNALGQKPKMSVKMSTREGQHHE